MPSFFASKTVATPEEYLSALRKENQPIDNSRRR